MEIAVERRSVRSGHDVRTPKKYRREAPTDLARWLYRQLERDYEYQSSDERIDEAIAATPTHLRNRPPVRLTLIQPHLHRHRGADDTSRRCWGEVRRDGTRSARLKRASRGARSFPLSLRSHP